MTVIALDQSAISAIGSTSALPNVSSVIKELLDNALDSGATNVSVEISLNTLDIIQVKDNGSGLTLEDGLLACKRNYTSKIKTKDDMFNIGGKSLGFRGQALANVAGMSGELQITTRVKGEKVGSIITYGRDGDPISNKKACHPVGTTVRIRDFLKFIPVRRQAAMKTTTKNVLCIKTLLQRYVMARPSIRFSLKLLKSNSDDWVYAPHPEPSVADAISKIINPEVVANCILESSSSSMLAESNTSETARRNYDIRDIRISVIIPDPHKDMSTLNKKGQFIVVDGRPMTPSRGFGKEVATCLKSSLTQANCNGQPITEPFMFITLSCHCGIYDVNIDPSKEDVLFDNQQELLFTLGILFNRLYRIRNSNTPVPTQESPSSPPINSNQKTILEISSENLRSNDTVKISQDKYGSCPCIKCSDAVRSRSLV